MIDSNLMSEIQDTAAQGKSTLAPEAEELTDCRKAFEEWFTLGNAKCKSIERDGESYKLLSANIAWGAWKAAWSNRK